MGRVRGGDGGPLKVGVPLHGAPQQLRGQPQRYVGDALLDVDPAGAGAAVHRHGARRRTGRQAGVTGDGHRRPLSVVPGQLPASQGVQQRPEGDVGNAVFQVTDGLQGRAVDLDGHRPYGPGGNRQSQGGQQAQQPPPDRARTSGLLHRVCRLSHTSLPFRKMFCGYCSGHQGQEATLKTSQSWRKFPNSSLHLTISPYDIILWSENIAKRY